MLNNLPRQGIWKYIGVKWEMFSTVCWPNVDQATPDTNRLYIKKTGAESSCFFETILLYKSMGDLLLPHSFL